MRDFCRSSGDFGTKSSYFFRNIDRFALRLHKTGKKVTTPGKKVFTIGRKVSNGGTQVLSIGLTMNEVAPIINAFAGSVIKSALRVFALRVFLTDIAVCSVQY